MAERSFTNLTELVQEETKAEPSNKGSMSTAKSSSGPGGHNFRDIGANFDFMNQKNIHHSFDKTLDALSGNISIIMRI